MINKMKQFKVYNWMALVVVALVLGMCTYPVPAKEVTEAEKHYHKVLGDLARVVAYDKNCMEFKTVEYEVIGDMLNQYAKAAVEYRKVRGHKIIDIYSEVDVMVDRYLTGVPLEEGCKSIEYLIGDVFTQ